VTGEFAALSATSPIDASKHEQKSRPTDDSLRTIVPAKCRMTNMRPAT
jgi:hypothetical protein